MADEELKITLKNEEFVRKLTEVQKAIQETKKAMDDLNKTKPSAFNTDAVSQYQKNAEALKEELDKVTKQEEELIATNKGVTKSTGEFGEAVGGMTKKLGPAALAISAITALMGNVTQAFRDTVAGAKAITIIGEVWKQIGYNIATANFNLQSWNLSIATAITNGKLINELRKQERVILLGNAKQQAEYAKLYYDASDKQQTAATRYKKLNETLAAHKEIVKGDIEAVNIHLQQVEVDLMNKPKSNTLLDEENRLLAQRYSIQAQGDLAERRLVGQISTAREAMFKKWTDEIEERLKRQDEFQSLSLKLLDEANQVEIDMLEGNDKIRAQRDYGLKQIDEFEKQMERLGKLSEKQKKQFTTLRAGVWMAFWEGLTPEAQKKLPQKDIDAISKMLLPQLQGLVKKDVPAEMAKIKAWVDSNKEFSLWNLLGLDPNDDEDKEAIEAVKNAAEKMQNIFEEILDKRVELVQRERELLDTRISETQREIDLEAELMKEGFANNLTARQQYLEQLKKQREQALADEDKAIKQQLLAQKLIQTTNILSGVSEIIKTSAKYPVIGMILAAASIASLFAIWSQSKSKATKLEEGGSGTVTGKRHSRGGEHFLDHVEIEQGEQWGVLSRRASGKYGDMFHDMVSSFNKDQMPEFFTPSTTNLVRVDNNGPNSRLDRVIKEQEKMNTELRRGQLYTVGNKRILKSGNKIRIIG